MKITIYADVLIIINFLVNYLLLRGAAILSGYGQSRWRIVLSALVGSLFSLLIFIDIESAVLLLLIKFAVLLLCCLIAFGFVNLRVFIRNFLCFLGINALSAGLLMLMADKSNVVYHNNLFFYFNISPIFLVGCMIVVFLALNIFSYVFKDKNVGQTCKIELSFNEASVELTGFYDTGFKLNDILSGKGVMLCGLESVKAALNQDTIKDITGFNANKNIESGTRFTPVFYSTINGGGVLPAIKPQKVKYIKNGQEKELKNVIIAITEEQFSPDVQLLYGKEIHEMIGD